MKVKSFLQDKLLAWGRDESGAVAIITAIVLSVLIGMVALVVDVGHLATVRNELQNAADAAALAGARNFYPDPGIIPIPNCSYAKEAAHDYLTRNYSDNQYLKISMEDIKTGLWRWTPGRFEVSPDCSYEINPDTAPAVEVTVKRDSALNPPVTMWFARIFGVETANAYATAVAINELPIGELGPCKVSIFAIPACVGNETCAKTEKQWQVTLGPDWADTGGYVSFTEHPSANDMKKLASGECGPGVRTGQEVFLQNGVDASVIMALKKRWEEVTKKGEKLVLTCPVVKGCTDVKYNHTATVAGFMDFEITEVLGPPDKKINGILKCHGEGVEDAGPGGEYFGLVSLLPKLTK